MLSRILMDSLVVVTHDPEVGCAGERIIALAHGRLVKDSRSSDSRLPPIGDPRGSSGDRRGTSARG
jgi:hypothetical protein